jgi:hypothetical protein
MGAEGGPPLPGLVSHRIFSVCARGIWAFGVAQHSTPAHGLLSVLVQTDGSVVAAVFLGIISRLFRRAFPRNTYMLSTVSTCGRVDYVAECAIICKSILDAATENGKIKDCVRVIGPDGSLAQLKDIRASNLSAYGNVEFESIESILGGPGLVWAADIADAYDPETFFEGLRTEPGPLEVRHRAHMGRCAQAVFLWPWFRVVLAGPRAAPGIEGP